MFDFERAGEDVWKALDYNRELFSDHPHGLVFWVTPPGRKRAAREAPHFWAQRSGVFDFRVDVPLALEQTQAFVSPDVRIESFAEIQRQLRLYQGLLDDLGAQAPALFRADLHHKVARLAYYVDMAPLAREHAQAAFELSREFGDETVRAAIEETLGDLALREADLGEARRRYQAALDIYPAIGARLGEANVLQSLGKLALQEGKPEAAFEQFRDALERHQAVGDRLGMGGDLTFMARAAIRAESFALAVLLTADALAIYRAIGDRLGQALALDDQGDALWALEMQQPALAAWWQARAIARAIGLPLAGRLDGVFAQIAQAMGPENYAGLEADLAAQAEARRQAGVAAARQTLEQQQQQS